MLVNDQQQRQKNKSTILVFCEGKTEESIYPVQVKEPHPLINIVQRRGNIITDRFIKDTR
jgi:hypothetical protein